MQSPQRTPQSNRRFAFAAIVGVGLFVAGMATLSLRYDTYEMRSGVMAPALEQGEVALVQPPHGAPTRGDVILIDGTYWPNVPPGTVFAMRVAAVGGDRVMCCDSDGRIVLNGRPLAESYASGASETFGRFDIVVPAGRMFLLGDDRDRARDSRELLFPRQRRTGDSLDNSTIAGDVTHATFATSASRGRVLTVISPPWRLRVVTPAGAASPHYYALAAVALGAVIFLAGALPLAARAMHRLSPALGKRRASPSW